MWKIFVCHKKSNWECAGSSVQVYRGKLFEEYYLLKVNYDCFVDSQHALSRKRKVKDQEKKDHWLDYADDKFDKVLIGDVKAVMKVLLLFIPVPIFWALFDQQVRFSENTCDLTIIFNITQFERVHDGHFKRQG